VAIDRLLYFRQSLNGDPIESFADFEAEFGPGADTDGVNAYLGLISGVLDNPAGPLASSGAGAVFNQIIVSMAGSIGLELTIMLGIEPNEPGSFFTFVQANYPGIQTLAAEIAAAQAQAAATGAGNSLRVVVRFASEMNGGNVYSGNPQAFVDTFQAVRTLIQAGAPNVLFAFSPELSGASLGNIGAYWPGTTYVDVISGTWYMHSDANFLNSVAFLNSYFAAYASYGKPFAIDEVGACSGTSIPVGNGTELNRVLPVLRASGVDLAHVTLFLDRPTWGADLAALTRPVTK
jgi:hypothetical protein